MILATAATAVTTTATQRATRQVVLVCSHSEVLQRMPCACWAGLCQLLINNSTTTTIQSVTLQQKQQQQQVRTLQQQNKVLQREVITLQRQQHVLFYSLQQQVSNYSTLFNHYIRLDQEVKASTRFHGNLAFHLRTLTPGRVVLTRPEDIPVEPGTPDSLPELFPEED